MGGVEKTLKETKITLRKSIDILAGAHYTHGVEGKDRR